MAQAKHYCATCGTHFGGPPNDMTPEEHIEVAHDGGIARIERNGNWRDYQRKQQFREDGGV